MAVLLTHASSWEWASPTEAAKVQRVSEASRSCFVDFATAVAAVVKSSKGPAALRAGVVNTFVSQSGGPSGLIREVLRAHASSKLVLKR